MDEGIKIVVPDPQPVVIPVEERGSLSRQSSKSRKSSTSTSSFEDIENKVAETPRPISAASFHSRASQRSRHSIHVTDNTSQHEPDTSEPATVEVGQIDMSDSPTSTRTTTTLPKGPSAFKTTSLDDPQFYAQTTSPSHKTSRVNIHAANRKFGGKDGDRDPENVNDIVKIKFEEIFAEPEGTYSFGTIWGATYRIFTDTKLWCYKFLSALCGVPCALCWGLHFACLSFCQIWYYQPTIRSFSIQVKPCARMFGIFINAFVEPCLMALGKILSSIRIYIVRE